MVSTVRLLHGVQVVLALQHLAILVIQEVSMSTHRSGNSGNGFRRACLLSSILLVFEFLVAAGPCDRSP